LATAFGSSTIQHARPYWLERTPYTFLLAALAPGVQQYLFSVQGWNPGGTSDMVASLYSLGITQYPKLQINVTYDGQTDRYFADEFPPALRQVRMGQAARSNISVSIVNNGSTTLTNIQAIYVMQSWRAPAAYKLLQGYALTAQEQQAALAAGLSTNPVQDEGMFPIPLDVVMDRSYDNRRIHPWLRFAQPIALAAPATVQTVDQIQARSNELLIVTGMGVDADFDDTPTITVDRDNDSSHVQLSADQLSASEPLEMWVPATNHLTFRLSAVNLPAAPLPVRLDVLRASMSLILALRMGLVDVSQVSQVLAALYQGRGLKDATARASKDASYLATGVLAGVR
jgi:hypothetical protein